MLNYLMREKQKSGLQDTWRKLKNLVLNKYIPSGFWGICSPWEIIKSPNPWKK
jgi:hypothetical protein